MRVIALHFEDLKTLFYYANHQMATVETSEVSSIMKGIAFRFDDLKTMFYYANQQMAAVFQTCKF